MKAAKVMCYTIAPLAQGQLVIQVNKLIYIPHIYSSQAQMALKTH